MNTSPSKRCRPQKPYSASDVLLPVLLKPQQKKTYKDAPMLSCMFLPAWFEEPANDKLLRQLDSGAK